MGEQENRGTDDIAEKIRKALNTALDLRDFNQLNQTISETVDSALGEARQQFERYRTRVEKDGGTPVDTQAARWVDDGTQKETNAGQTRTQNQSQGWTQNQSQGWTQNQSQGWTQVRPEAQTRFQTRQDGDWRRGTREPGDTGRYTYNNSGIFGAAENYTYGNATGAQTASGLPKPADFRVNWRGRISGILLSVCGGIGTSVFGLLTLLFLCMSLIVLNDPFGWGMTLFLAVVTGGFGAMLGLGITKSGRVSRLKRYLDEIKRFGKPYCETGRLGLAVGRGADFVKKDLRKILSAGMLPDARLAEDGSYLLMDQETYRQYWTAQQGFKARQEEQRMEIERQKAAEAQRTAEAQRAGENRSGAAVGNGTGSGSESSRAKGGTGGGPEGSRVKGGNGTGGGSGERPAAATGDAEVDAAIVRGEEQMELLDRMRRTMPESVMTDKLLRLDRVLERLFETLRKYPDQLDELEKFMEYYLPTTVKLVTAYKEFSEVEFPGDNITGAKKEIEKTMDTINGAFEKLLDDMYEDTAFDVMTDASVLQSMLKREGLTDSDFQMDQQQTGSVPEADKKKE